MNEKWFRDNIINLIKSDPYYDDPSYIIVFIWSIDGDKLIDMWKFSDNHVDDGSGPLGSVKVYREGKICNYLGIASGNMLIALGYEEKFKR